MATKSILKNVTIKNKTLARSFVYALENAEHKKDKKVKLKKAYSVADTDDIKSMFGDSK